MERKYELDEKLIERLLRKLEKPYLIFRGMEAKDENIIGNLLLETAEAIHDKNITGIDHKNRHVFVKKDPKYTK